MARDTRPAWARIPEEGPLADVLLRRRDWLKTQASGGPASRRVTLHDLADDGRTEDRIISKVSDALVPPNGISMWV